MPIRSCVTISLVPEARGGPFVFWDDLAAGIRAAADLGFDAVEIFPPSADSVDAASLRQLLDDHHLKLAAVGTGAGWVIQRLTLTHHEASRRARAREFVRSVIDLAGPFGASAIVGSMQGRWGDGVEKTSAMGWLADALESLGRHAATFGAPLLYEPLNRYETNLVTTVAAGVDLIAPMPADHVQLLADLFHMNIEERDIAEALRFGGSRIGHLHFVDSNRRPAGLGHIDYKPIAAALRDINYDGYASAEALPYPDSLAAANQTMEIFGKVFGTSTH